MNRSIQRNYSATQRQIAFGLLVSSLVIASSSFSFAQVAEKGKEKNGGSQEEKTSEPAESAAPKPSAGRALTQTGDENELSAVEQAKRLAARRRGEITFDDLKFDIEKGGKFERKMLTKDIESLNKKTVRLRGYMFPTFRQDGITEFVLVRDNMECCFGPGAAIFDCVRVKMDAGKTTSFSIRPIAVKGKFEIEEYRLPNGFLAAIYKLTAVEVK